MKVYSKDSKYKLALTVLLFVAIFHGPLLAQKISIQDYKVKAIFIYHFTKYIKWSDFDTSEAFNIAILGDSDIVIPLREIARIRSVDDRKVTIKRFQTVEDIDACHILFISESMKNQIDTILQTIGDENILTVSSSEGFADKGVAINFVIVHGKIKFEMNSHALERAGLRASSQLKKLAILVEEKGR